MRKDAVPCMEKPIPTARKERKRQTAIASTSKQKKNNNALYLFFDEVVETVNDCVDQVVEPDIDMCCNENECADEKIHNDSFSQTIIQRNVECQTDLNFLFFANLKHTCKSCYDIVCVKNETKDVMEEKRMYKKEEKSMQIGKSGMDERNDTLNDEDRIMFPNIKETIVIDNDIGEARSLADSRYEKNEYESDESSNGDLEERMRWSNRTFNMEANLLNKQQNKLKARKEQSAFVNKDLQRHPFVSLDRIQFDDELVHHYTGLEDWDNFNFVFNFLTIGLNESAQKNRSDLSPKSCFLMLCVYLRLHYDFFELSRMFGVSKTAARSLCISWLKFCVSEFKSFTLWPNSSLVKFFSPSDFRAKFSTTRIILDCTEIPIMKSSHRKAQSATFSNYKHKNTAKVLVGCTPGGLTSFVSDSYAGSVSDRQIFEKSNLVENLSKGDSVMVDKGINIEDILSVKQINVNMPTFLKGMNRLPANTLQRDKKIASKRVHIERLIGNAKSFRILRGPLNRTETNMSSEIIYLAFMLANFKSNIVPDTA